jgi:uncharacterized repeat protein (TIGR03803 family)
MTATGSPTWLHSFCLQAGCADGNNPQTLTLAPDGNFYGTTTYGGANSGTGTVFKITSTGQLTTLHTFHTADGTNPNGDRASTSSTMARIARNGRSFRTRASGDK